ncbi:VWA domain containing CoxE-like protein [Planctomycetes bacterium CA13]|uniref:VWA domain containing CoxE-like protein n=1 Tax=Novipirellula herctigrandis TaxID=2527986 RepID=A0A5C5Z9L4_9BACT|nr:VWA domain containing CoxE-like protein [Planctomycetes bacterium CA13]
MPDSKRYLRPEVTARIRRLELTARRVVEGFLSGIHRSPYFGQSIEFLQHRQYTRGDEIRHIDWKVYARQDRLHIKQYEEETNLRLTLLVDRSASMSYGDGESNKFDYSASIAASIAYLALRQKDATGLFTFDTKVQATVPAKSNQQQLSRILSMLDSVGADGRTDFVAVAKEIAQGIPRRGLVVVVSDLLGVDSLIEGLRYLRSRGHDVAVFHVLHSDELDFEFNGATRFEGLESEDILNCNPRALREGYLEALNEFLSRTKKACGRLSIDYLQVRTNEPLDAVLAKFLAARQSLPKLKK